MGFNFDIELRIRHIQMGDIISSDTQELSRASDGYVGICTWNSRMFLDHRAAIIDIRNQYSERQAAVNEYGITVPKEALRPICSYLFSRCCLPEDDPDFQNDWYGRDAYESTNYFQAQRLHALLCFIDHLDHMDMKHCGAEAYIPDPDKRSRFLKNPQEYECEFIIWNHYSGDK